MEGLEARQLLAANIFLPDVDLDLYDGPRNVGSVQALQLTEREQITQSGQNDVIAKAELIPLGNGPWAKRHHRSSRIHAVFALHVRLRWYQR